MLIGLENREKQISQVVSDTFFKQLYYKKQKNGSLPNSSSERIMLLQAGLKQTWQWVLANA